MDAETQAVLQVQAGDTSAFRSIVDQHGPVMYRAALMVTRDPVTAEDAVQETFLKAWKGINSFKAGTQLRSWLMRILFNHLNGARRRKFINAVRLLPGLSEPTAPDSPENQYLHSELADELKALLDSLRRDERTVVVMHYYVDMSLSEISNATGWPAGTVRSRLSRALNRLRMQLGQTKEGGVGPSEVDLSAGFRRMSSDET